MKLILHAVSAYQFHLSEFCPVQHLWSFLQAPIYSLAVCYSCIQRALSLSSYQWCETLHKLYLLSQVSPLCFSRFVTLVSE